MAIRPEALPGPYGPEPAQSDPFFGGGDPFAAMGRGNLNLDPLGEPQQMQQPITGDLYPIDREEYDKLLKWCRNAFQAADDARKDYDERWSRYYRLYRSYMKRKAGEWRSTVFIPIAFWIIETITPRLVAQLPKFFTQPFGPEDRRPAEQMEQLLEWATDESGLYVELVKAYKSALKYGTGILKTFHRIDKRRARKVQPLTAPLIVPRQQDTGMTDMDGNPIVQMYEDVVGEVPAGMAAQRYSYTAYDGPAAECIDIFNFWTAPEATDEQSARYVIHRTYKEMSHIQKLVQEGIYRWPDDPDMTPDDVADTSDEPNLRRLSDIGLGAGIDSDPTRRPVELLEFWTDDGRVITMANRKAIIRVQENPFDHSEKPFVRFVDYLQEHEFWGVGEIEPLEGLQDLQNALTNSRIDNIRLVLNSMFAVNTNNVEDIRDLKMRPGGVIRLKGDFDPRQVLQRIDLGDVTGSAFEETQIVSDFIERVSGISAYQMGMDSPNLNSTATGVAIIQEQGASRFGLKSRLSELMALKRIGRHYGSILQQFTTEERMIRMFGPEGQLLFQSFSPESIQGALDYDVEAGSPTQTQTARQQNAQNVFQLLQGAAAQIDPATGMPMVPTSGVLAALDDLLTSMNIKDKQRYLQPTQPQLPPPMMQDPSMMGQPQPMGGGQMPVPAPPQQMGDYQGGNPAEGTFGQANAQRMYDEMAALYQQGGSAGGY